MHPLWIINTRKSNAAKSSHTNLFPETDKTTLHHLISVANFVVAQVLSSCP